MFFRYSSVSEVFSAFVAAAVIACPTTGSAIPLTCDVCTSMVAGCASTGSVFAYEVARAENSSGMTTTAA